MWKWRYCTVFHKPVPLLCHPFPEKSHLWPKCGDRCLFLPPTISDELQKHQSQAQTSIYILRSLEDINIYIYKLSLCSHPKGCSPCPVWSRRCNKTWQPQGKCRKLSYWWDYLILFCKAALLHFWHCFFFILFFFIMKLQVLCNFSLGRIFAKVLDNLLIRLKKPISIYSFSTFSCFIFCMMSW